MYELTSYSGNNPNKKAQRARKFDDAQRRLEDLERNVELVNKLKGNYPSRDESQYSQSTEYETPDKTGFG